MTKSSWEGISRGGRAQKARELTGLSRQAFARKNGISYATLQHWENATEYGFPEKAVAQLVKALANSGIHCSHEWLMNGTGKTPSQIRALPVEKTIEKSDFDHHFNVNTGIARELDIFLTHDNDAIPFIVPDNAIEPYYFPNDLVAGIRHYGADIRKLIGMVCIATIQGGDMILRLICKGSLHNHYHLTRTNPRTEIARPFLYDVELISAAPVIWMRRQQPVIIKPETRIVEA